MVAPVKTKGLHELCRSNTSGQTPSSCSKSCLLLLQEQFDGSRWASEAGRGKLNLRRRSRISNVESLQTLHEVRVKIRNYFIKLKGWFQSQQKEMQCVVGKEGGRKWLEKASGDVNVQQTKCEWTTKKMLP